LLGDPYRVPIEQLVSEHYQEKWQVRQFTDLDDFASHPAAILSDGAHPVFVKLSEAANGLDQFEVELAGLKLLSERAGALIPALIGIIPVEGGYLLVLEAVQAVERTPERWREIGRALARIHQVKGEQNGYEMQGYFGPLYQDNRPTKDWRSFYLERRLWPRFMGAIDAGNLPTETIRQIEQLIRRLPKLDIPEIQPSLLHGDAQQNNFITTGQGVLVIDPAVYYGNPEMDLAYVDYFQAVPEAVFQGYQEILPIAPGFQERRDLWRIPAYLAAVIVEGRGYLGRLVTALQKYL
jgi:fructosamine-3-kinase